MRLTILALFLLAGSVFADPPRLAIAAEVKPTGQYVELLPDTDAVSVTYVGLSSVEPIPARWLNDKRVFLLDTRGLATGRYKFIAVGASKTGEQAVAAFVVVLGEAPPIPVPPDPAPPAPAPADPLWPAVKAAYRGETAAARQLAGVFQVAGTATVNDPAIPTLGALYEVLSKASQSLVPLPTLQGVRQIVGQELVMKLGTDPTRPLDAVLRKQASEQFQRVSQLYIALAEGK